MGTVSNYEKILEEQNEQLKQMLAEEQTRHEFTRLHLKNKLIFEYYVIIDSCLDGQKMDWYNDQMNIHKSDMSWLVNSFSQMYNDDTITYNVKLERAKGYQLGVSTCKIPSHHNVIEFNLCISCIGHKNRDHSQHFIGDMWITYLFKNNSVSRKLVNDTEPRGWAL